MGPVLEKILQMFRNYRKFVIISRIDYKIFIGFAELWPKTSSEILRNYRYQSFGENGTFRSDDRSRYLHSPTCGLGCF